MAKALHKFFDPLFPISPRVSIGGGVLALVLLGESTLAFMRPLV
jgi:hypothetical protein